MMKRITSILMGALLSFSPVQAEEGSSVTVLELFTSQGCNSCPPADAIINGLKNQPNILALTWSVDYWDRMGWEDTMALPYHTTRQTAYNKRFGRSGLYTPQLVVDGILDCVGSHKSSVDNAIVEAADIRGEYAVPVSLSVDGDQVRVSLPEKSLPDMNALPRLSGNSASIRLVYYLSDVIVKIDNGENEGRRLHYSNVVRHTDVIGEWKGDAIELTADIDKEAILEADHVAVLVQYGYGHGPVIGASSSALQSQQSVQSR